MKFITVILASVFYTCFLGQELDNKEYYKSGKLEAEYSGEEGIPDGVLKGYYISGELQYLVNYSQGKQEGLTQEFYRSGKLKKKYYFKNGVAYSSNSFHENGNLADECNCEEGRKLCDFKLFYSNGKVRAIGRLKNEEYDGYFTFYDSIGAVASEGMYGMGELIGPWFINDSTGGIIQYYPNNNNNKINDSLLSINIENIIAFQNSILAKDTFNHEALLKRSFYKQQLNDYKGAISDLDFLMTMTPENYNAINSRALCKVEIDDLYGALHDFNKALSIKPDFIDSYWGRANTYRKLNKFKLSLNDVGVLIKMNKDNDSLAENCYLLKGDNLNDIGEYEESIKAFDKVLFYNRKNAFAYINRGMANYHLEKYNVALIDVNKAIAISPDYSQAYEKRGEIKIALKNYKEAIEDFDKSLTIGPRRSSTYHNRAAAKCFLNDFEGALTDLATAIEIKSPDFNQEESTILHRYCYQKLKR